VDAAGGSTTKYNFTFDRVFGQTCSQHDIFEEVAIPTVDGVMNGYNGTIFAYGQTGSGKSFTMEGASLYDEQTRGLIPRMFEYLFAKIR
jgi:kinesin family protein 5